MFKRMRGIVCRVSVPVLLVVLFVMASNRGGGDVYATDSLLLDELGNTGVFELRSNPAGLPYSAYRVVQLADQLRRNQQLRAAGRRVTRWAADGFTFQAIYEFLERNVGYQPGGGALYDLDEEVFDF